MPFHFYSTSFRNLIEWIWKYMPRLRIIPNLWNNNTGLESLKKLLLVHPKIPLNPNAFWHSSVIRSILLAIVEAKAKQWQMRHQNKKYEERKNVENALLHQILCVPKLAHIVYQHSIFHLIRFIFGCVDFRYRWGKSFYA